MLRSVSQRFRCRRLLRSIIRDARARYPHPWDDSARVRYIAERYFVESLDQKRALTALRLARAARLARKEKA